MTDWQQVNIRVPESTYENWKEAADSEYGTITDLVRTSVRRELDGHHGAVSGGATDSNDSAGTQVAEVVDRLENTVRDMDKRLSAVKETVDSTNSDISQEAAVRETLETIPEEAVDSDGEPHPPRIASNFDDWGLTAKNVAARLDASESTVQEILEDLTEDSPEFQSTGYKGHTLYFKVDY